MVTNINCQPLLNRKHKFKVQIYRLRFINKEQHRDNFTIHCRNVCKPAGGNESKTCYFREAICRARWLIHLYFLYIHTISRNEYSRNTFHNMRAQRCI